MLDLDFLADRQAKNLSQDPEDWRTAVWSEGFQKLSQNMSDGEVETLITFSPSVKRLQDIVSFLEHRSKELGTPPFTVLADEARLAGLSAAEWILRFNPAE